MLNYQTYVPNKRHIMPFIQKDFVTAAVPTLNLVLTTPTVLKSIVQKLKKLAHRI